MAWIKDKLMNRKIEGESSFDGLEPLAEKLSIDDESQDFVLDGSLRVDEIKTKPVDGKQATISGGYIILFDSDSTIALYNNDGVLEIPAPVKITGDGEFSGDVVVKTIKQSQANWNANDSFDTLDVPSGLVYTKKYARLEEINGVIYVVICFSIENTTENAISFLFDKVVELPESIASKIYDFDGYTVAESHTANIMAEDCFYASGNILYNKMALSLRNRSNVNRLEAVFANNVSIPANTIYNFSFRCFLTTI